MKNISIEKKRAWTGIFFISPWIIGLILFFIYPLIQTLIFSFSDVSFHENGGLNIKSLEEGLFDNYLYAFTKDSTFLQYFWETVKNMVLLTPCIVIFSMFVAVVLNQNFRGKLFMRAMFFLPVIIAAGVISSIITQSLTEVAQGTSAESNIFNSVVLSEMLIDAGMPEAVVDIITGIINNVVDLVWDSGVQILLFLTGLLSVSPTYYEVANVEGATKWEAFWKITFPMMMPYILVNLIYTIIDSFTKYDNKVMKYLVDMNYKNINFSYASAMYWIYFIVVMAVIVFIYFVVNKQIYYDVD